MSPIIDIQRRVAEVGRIRIGTSTKTDRGHKTPKRLSTFRLTSQDRARLDAAAALYGGEVVPWADKPGHFEVVTTVAEIPVVVMPGQAISQWWELWAGGECKRRCDGERDTIADGPCQCPAAYDERSELAGKGKACRPTTRLNVILREVPGVGYWRFESHGFYAAVELAGSVGILEEATRRGALLPARLRFEERTVVRGAQTKRFPVPMLDVDVTFERLQAISRGDMPAIAGSSSVPLELEAGPTVDPDGPGHTPAPDRGGVTMQEAREAVERETQTRRHARSAEPIGPTVARGDRGPVTVPDETAVSPPVNETGGDGSQVAVTVPDATEGQPGPSSHDQDVIEAEPVEEGGIDPDDPFPGEKYVTQAQAKLVHVRATRAGLSEEELDRIIMILTGGRTDSAKLIPRSKLDDVLESIVQAST